MSDPAVPPTPTSVEEAREHLAKWPQSMNRDEFLADVEVLLTAARAEVRSSTLREVREMVEEVTGCCSSCRDVGDRILAGLAKMEAK